MYRFTLLPVIRSLAAIVTPIPQATTAVVTGALILAPISGGSATSLLSPLGEPVDAVPITSEKPAEAGGDTEAGTAPAAGPLGAPVAATPCVSIAQEVTVTIGEVGESCWDRCHMQASDRVNNQGWTEAFAEAMFRKCHKICECIESGASVC